MTLSDNFRNMVRVRHLPRAGDAEPGEYSAIGRLAACRDSFSPVEVSFPASILGNSKVAQWIREHDAAIDVRDMGELHAAVLAGIHMSLLTVHTATLGSADVGVMASLGVGRMVLGCAEHVDELARRDGGRIQNVMLRMRQGAGGDFVFDSREADRAVERIGAQPNSNLIGLHCDIDEVVGVRALIGDMVAQMEHIRRRHGLVLTRLSLGGDRLDVAGRDVRHEFALELGESTDDACATMRYPRPDVALALGPANIEACAA